MLSESQERMLIVLKPGREELAKAIFDKWELDFAVIGRVTDTGRLVLEMHGETCCDWRWGRWSIARRFTSVPGNLRRPRPYRCHNGPPARPGPEIVHRLIGCPDWRPALDLGAVRQSGRCRHHRAVRRQLGRGPRPWDQQGARHRDGLHAALLLRRSRPGRCTGRRRGMAQPDGGGASRRHHRQHELRQSQKPRIMGQFAGCIQGMVDACNVLEFPVVSAMSASTTRRTEAILPTPAMAASG